MTYTLTQVLDVMKDVVDEFGTDHIEELCTYRVDEREWDEYEQRYMNTVIGTEPACIVAQVIYRLDPDLLTQVENDDTWEAQAINDQFEPAANRALQVAQEAQDGRGNFSGHQTWGTALYEAREAVTA